MDTLLYDGTFEGWLTAVFEAYEYRYADADICTEAHFNGNLFGTVHRVVTAPEKSSRVWTGLKKKLSPEGLKAIRYAFLSELPGMESTLYRYARYIFSTAENVETDFSHADVLTVSQVARTVWREQHRMEAFIRFQKTADGLYYALIGPDHNVLPLIAPHFYERYADQAWLIYDSRRRWGLYYNGQSVEEVSVAFIPESEAGKNAEPVYDTGEVLYQALWRQYFQSVNIPARKNLKLQLQHMPRRYWKFLTEKKPGG
ncbi:MAG TPA: TIGR03915 family putative DNA repair protein [Chitinophagaceae bacterium]|jgi:probable DNA metabolism protein|nr:TIGR03915 family putative DNA repair protein [Chitinophagaceae bacterium]